MPSIKNTLILLGATASMATPLKKRLHRTWGSYENKERALIHYDIITGNGSYQSEYFSPENVPYHSVETMMVEAPDHGHESVSETYSFWVWLEAVHGKLTCNYDGVEKAWSYLEKHLIPDSENQPGNKKYNPQNPATYAPESDDIQDYPAKLVFKDGIVGEDPIAQELAEAYGTWDMYAMHWIIDGDNWYGYGQQGDGVSKPSFINTFQRGASESTWKTVPHPCWESMKWGGNNGFLDLFTLDNSYAKQWRYTAAPDADARAIQAAYFAWLWAEEDGLDLSDLAAKAARLGDYLRYSHYDKYFKKIGNCIDYQKCEAGKGKNSAHYLISWYFAWGGGLEGDWSWRIGSSHTHSGYQSPLAAWILSTQSAFRPKSATGKEDWAVSMQRQLELFRWLQASEGCIAGGATNSWQGHYAQPSSEISSFYGMWYDWQPVYHDPPSNNWTGMQGWGMERVCSLYYLSGNKKAGVICREWAKWAKDNIRVSSREIIHATTLEWSGNPEDYKEISFDENVNRSLHGTVSSEGLDIGTLASIIKALFWYSMKDNDMEGQRLVQKVLDYLEDYRDDLGYTNLEERADYIKFGEETYIPAGWTGKNAQGATIKSGSTFIDIRPKYKEDPNWSQVEDYLNGGNPPQFTYHRFWAQTELMVANGLMAIYNNLVQDCSIPTTTNTKTTNKTTTTTKSSPTPTSRTVCPLAIRNQGYSCCHVGCEVVYSDEDGDWGVENFDWCGCGNDPLKCNANVIAQGYPCCSKCGYVYWVDEDGDWGFENGEWCGMQYRCDS